jgi:heptosyltransferase III
LNPQSIIISRTDSIGDVVLTLPMCGILKSMFPACKIYFLAKAYTRAIVETCAHVDQFINWDEMKEMSPGAQIEILQKTKAEVIIHVFPRKEILWLAKRAHIPMRIATGRRLYTIGKCNKLVFFSRKGSDLHEAQLNLKLLKPLGWDQELSREKLVEYYGFSRVKEEAKKKAKDFLAEFSSKKKRIILHPLSKGSASEWSLEHYQKLIDLLPSDSYDIFVTGTKEEGERIKASFPLHGKGTHDVTGKFSLEELIAFIGECDCLVAASTGPLHIAAASGIQAIGLYSPKRPIHPGRWAPLGARASFITASQHPKKGYKLDITAEQVASVIFGQYAG